MAAREAPPSLGFSRQEHWNGWPFSSPTQESEKWEWSRSVVSDCVRPHGLQPTRLLHPWIFQARVLEWGAFAYSRALGTINLTPSHRREWVLISTQIRTIPSHLLINLDMTIGLENISKPTVNQLLLLLLFSLQVTSTSFETRWTTACQAPLTWDFPGKNTRVSCRFLLRGYLCNPEIKPACLTLAG